jgi:hypothetical protein
MLGFIPVLGRVFFEMLTQPQQCLVMRAAHRLGIDFQ